MNVSVIVPVYNGTNSLRALASELERVLSNVAEQYELVLVNDGSSNQCWSIILELMEKYAWIRGIDLMRNYGQHNATLCGIREAQYEITVTMDDDLQNPPAEIPKLLDKLNAGYDVVYGVPQKVREIFWRALASQVIRLVLRRVMGSNVAWQVSSFRTFRTSIRDAFVEYSSPSVFVDVLLTWGGGRFAAVPVRHDARSGGESTYTFGKLLGLALNMLTSFSTLPLRFASMVGFFFTLFGIGVLIYVVGRYFINGGSIPGFPFLASVIAIFSGATLFALGIIGEYLARIYIHSMRQPSYIIRGK